MSMSPNGTLSPNQPPTQTKECQNAQSTEYDDDNERLTHSGVECLQGRAGPVNPSRCASILNAVACDGGGNKERTFDLCDRLWPLHSLPTLE